MPTKPSPPPPACGWAALSTGRSVEVVKPAKATPSTVYVLNTPAPTVVLGTAATTARMESSPLPPMSHVLTVIGGPCAERKVGEVTCARKASEGPERAPDTAGKSGEAVWPPIQTLLEVEMETAYAASSPLPPR